VTRSRAVASPTIHYREATLADVPALAGLRRDGEAGGAPEERMRRYLAGEHHPRDARAPRTMWLAARGEMPIGYAAGHLTRRFDCEGELQWIYVARAHRGSGVATELLRRVAGWFVAQGARRVCVDVGSEEARVFYRRQGAVELDRHWMLWSDIGRVR
jgi:GNAT superfamily N-acetyltransferase